MNDKEAMVSLPMLFRARYSLQELADAQNSAVPIEAIQHVVVSDPPPDMSNLPTGFLGGRLPGWNSDNVIDFFGLLGSQSESWERLYCGFGFDMLRPGSPLPRVRIGTILDDTTSCQHPNGAEGFGLYDGSGTASSGTVDFRGVLKFSKASIYVGAVEFREGDLRLGGISSGRLSVYHEGEWGTICNTSFTNADAQVACRILGFAGGTTFWAPGSPGSTAKIWMSSVQCVGHETNFADCGHSGWVVPQSCDHDMDVGIACLTDDQYLTFTGCYFIGVGGANQTVTPNLPFGPQSEGYNTATCGVACSAYKFMALHNNGRCSCGDTVIFNNKTAENQCGAVCPGELELGPTRLCGTLLATAVYDLMVLDVNVTAPEPEVQNATMVPNITILNITPSPPPELPIIKDPLLQFTLPENLQSTPNTATWLLESDVAKLIAGRHYRLCTDLDGDQDSYLRVGDTGLKVYLSPITAVLPNTLQAANHTQQLMLHCGHGGCGQARIRAAYLATACGGSPATECAANNAPTTSAGEAELWYDGTIRISLDTRCLPPRHDYRLCLLPLGDTGMIGEDSGFGVALVPDSLVAYA